MRDAEHQDRHAEPAPGIDELSARLAALANRIDTINGGRRAQPARGEAARRAPPAAPKAALKAASARQWPRLPDPAGNAASPAAPAPGSRAVNMGDHDQRIAELTAMRDRQAKELRETRDHIERQALALKSLRELVGERDGEVADLTRRLMEAETDKTALESQLASALREANNASTRLAAHEGTLHHRSADLAAADQLIEELRAGLAAAQVTVATQVIAAEERLQHRFEAERKLYRNEAERRLGDAERHNADLLAELAARDSHIGALEHEKALLGDEMRTLRTILDDTRAELAGVSEAIAGKDSHIAFLDTVIKVNRDNSEATVRELIAEFDRERSAFSREREELIAKARTASAFQRDIADLLPRLLQRRAAAA